MRGRSGLTLGLLDQTTAHCSPGRGVACSQVLFQGITWVGDSPAPAPLSPALGARYPACITALSVLPSVNCGLLSRPAALTELMCHSNHSKHVCHPGVLSKSGMIQQGWGQGTWNPACLPCSQLRSMLLVCRWYLWEQD